jgi:YD repeat-containing protein
MVESVHKDRYDNNGNQTSVNAPLSRNTSNLFDPLNRPIQVTDPTNGIAQYTYDANNQVTSVTDPRGLLTSWLLAGRARISRKCDFVRPYLSY